MEQFDEKGLAICQVCGRSFGQITYRHLKVHDEMSMNDYKQKFPDSPLTSKSFSSRSRLKNVKMFVEKPEITKDDLVEVDESGLMPQIDKTKIDELKLKRIDKIPEVSTEFKKSVTTLIQDVIKDDDVIQLPTNNEIQQETEKVFLNENTINKNKLTILKFLSLYFKDVENSYFIEKINLSGMLEYRIVTDICIPSIKLDLEFINSFWHNQDPPKITRNIILENDGWKVIEFQEKNPTVESVKNYLKKFKLI